jgi:SIR2-like domain
MAQEPTIAVLLGAGASVDAGIPTSVGMTDAVIERIRNQQLVGILEFVRLTIAASLAQQHSSLGWPPLKPVDVSVDVERFFASVELLSARHDQPWSPFVATWHPGLERINPRSDSLLSQRTSLERAIREIASERGIRTLADEIAKFVNNAIVSARGADVSQLLETARIELLRSLFAVLEIDDPAKTKYLSPFIDLTRKQGSLTIATLNYDRSIENVAELKGEPCDTGIETWLESGALDWPTSGLRLLKLHGSIDWVFEHKFEYHELPLQRIRKVVGADEKARYDAPAVVFGEAGKLRAEGPFVELLLAWSTQLQEADSLLVVGYSFRDTHVNEMIARWFNAVATRRIVVLDPADLDSGGRDSFATRLTYVDETPPKAPTAIPRVRHLAATTRESLDEAIKEASLPIGSPVAR